MKQDKRQEAKSATAKSKKKQKGKSIVD